MVFREVWLLPSQAELPWSSLCPWKLGRTAPLLPLLFQREAAPHPLPSLYISENLVTQIYLWSQNPHWTNTFEQLQFASKTKQSSTKDIHFLHPQTSCPRHWNTLLFCLEDEGGHTEATSPPPPLAWLWIRDSLQTTCCVQTWSEMLEIRRGSEHLQSASFAPFESCRPMSYWPLVWLYHQMG